MTTPATPVEPRTAAGRAFLAEGETRFFDWSYMAGDVVRAVLAIEAEAVGVPLLRSAEQWHQILQDDPLLPNCSGTHAMGYGYCQRLALAASAPTVEPPVIPGTNSRVYFDPPEGGAATGLDVQAFNGLWDEWILFNEDATRKGSGFTRDQMNGAAGFHSWVRDRLAAAGAAEEER